ncbi:MAG: hypothetical protein RL097_410 [Candidatus Parcubacteria bacterium]|jgi:hypothetical protein
MEPEKTPTPTEQPHLLTVLQSLNVHIERQNSLKYAFVRGMVYGLGTVVGATVLVAILGSVIVGVLDTFTEAPLFNDALQTILTPERP